jgi:hypothetical protein
MLVDLRLRYATRYAIAFVGSLLTLPLAQLAASLVAGDPGWVEDPARSSCCRVPMLVLVILPLCAVAEVELLGRLRLRWWAYLPIMAVSLFLASGVYAWIMVGLVLGSVIGGVDLEGVWRGIAIIGLQDVLWGGACWTLLRLSDALLPPAKRQDGESAGASGRDVGVLE